MLLIYKLILLVLLCATNYNWKQNSRYLDQIGLTWLLLCFFALTLSSPEAHYVRGNKRGLVKYFLPKLSKMLFLPKFLKIFFYTYTVFSWNLICVFVERTSNSVTGHYWYHRLPVLCAVVQRNDQWRTCRNKFDSCSTGLQSALHQFQESGKSDVSSKCHY